jgi:hypothetical protein
MLEIPRYAELLQRTDAPAGSAWGIFGADDRVGTLNFIGAEQILAAAASVKDGRVFSLNLPLELPDPGFFHRSPPHQTIVRSNHGAIVDDYLDRLYPQSSSHWDALRHSAHPEHGFFNAVSREVALDATSVTSEFTIGLGAASSLAASSLTSHAPSTTARAASTRSATSRSPQMS